MEKEITEEKKHKQLFEKWLDENLKKNSSLISKIFYDGLVACVVAKNNGLEITSSFDIKIRRKVNSQKYMMMNYPALKIFKKLCVPKKNTDCDDRDPLQGYRQIATKEEVFHVIKDVHTCANHSGIMKTYTQCQWKLD